MFGYVIMILVPSIWTLNSGAHLNASTYGSSSHGTNFSGVAIRSVEFATADKALRLHYQIINGSAQDIWLSENVSVGGYDCEVYVAKDEQTLVVRRRFDVRSEVIWATPPKGTYVRLPVGEKRTESLLLPLPVWERGVFVGVPARQGIVRARRLLLEIGFYTAGQVRSRFGWYDRPENEPPGPTGDRALLSALFFTLLNESIVDKGERILVGYEGHEDAHVLSLVRDDVNIPCAGLRTNWDTGPQVPDLTECTQAEFRYEPSMLEYFFPYASQQNLLNSAEREYLRSRETSTVNTAQYLQVFAAEVSKGRLAAIVDEHAKASVVCNRSKGLPTSFKLYGDRVLEIEGTYRFKYAYGFENPQRFIPTVQPFNLRVECAGNLYDLWHRLRFYSVAQHAPRDLNEYWKNLDRYGQVIPPEFLHERKELYPSASDWCADLLLSYQVLRGSSEAAASKYRCPAVGYGKCNYAMNPDCRPDSPSDVVLLFETKSDWNQHGGPELFTFDNHDPRGGLVLLNDGTVKFIRTDEELKQLRWK